MNKITKARKRLLKNLPRENEYSLSFFRVLIFLSPFFFLLVLVLLLEQIATLSSKPFYFSVLFVALINLPVFILLYNHLVNAPITKIKFDTNNNILRLYTKQREIDISYSSILFLEIVESNFFNRFPWFLFEYATLYLKENEKIYVSCLLLNPNIFLRFGITKKANIIRSYFPYIKKSVLQVT